MKYAVGIDIGGTNTRIALVDENYNIINRIQFPTINNDPDMTVNTIKLTIEDFKENIVGIGLSCPGPLDLIAGRVLTPPNLTGRWHHFPLVDRLTEATGYKVFLNNDANLATLAEATIGQGKDYNVVQFVTVSTGIGSGLCINKELFIGEHGFAQETANIIIFPDGPSHGELVKGGVEAIASGTAIVNRAKAAGLDVYHAGQVNDLAIAGNEAAIKIMSEAKLAMANYLAGQYATIDPGIIILGGSVSLKIDGYLDEVTSMVKEKVFSALTSHVNIKLTNLGEDSGLIGAAILAFKKAE